MNWTEQDLLDRARRRFAEDLSASLSPCLPDLNRAIEAAAKLASTPGAVEAFNALTGDEALALSKQARGRIRQPKGMNKTEARYAQYLELQKRAGTVVWFKYEGITVKLGNDCRYTPDFAVMLASGAVELHEVKGRKGKKAYCEDDARVKIAVAAEQFPFRFVMVWSASNGEWVLGEF